jgi:putative oxidoreductase
MFTRAKALDLTIFLVRLSAAIIFIQVGGFKLFNWFGGMASVGASMNTLMWIAGTLEVVGGILILLGLFTRVTAFILSGEMAVAFFIGHAIPSGHFWPILNHGEPAFLLCFIFLFISAYGAGGWSLDRVMHNRKNTSTAAGV